MDHRKIKILLLNYFNLMDEKNHVYVHLLIIVIVIVIIIILIIIIITVLILIIILIIIIIIFFLKSTIKFNQSLIFHSPNYNP